MSTATTPPPAGPCKGSHEFVIYGDLSQRCRLCGHSRPGMSSRPTEPEAYSVIHGGDGITRHFSVTGRVLCSYRTPRDCPPDPRRDAIDGGGLIVYGALALLAGCALIAAAILTR